VNFCLKYLLTMCLHILNYYTYRFQTINYTFNPSISPLTVLDGICEYL
jgi:hypothetical protein